MDLFYDLVYIDISKNKSHLIIKNYIIKGLIILFITLYKRLYEIDYFKFYQKDNFK